MSDAYYAHFTIPVTAVIRVEEDGTSSVTKVVVQDENVPDQPDSVTDENHLQVRAIYNGPNGPQAEAHWDAIEAAWNGEWPAWSFGW